MNCIAFTFLIIINNVGSNYLIEDKIIDYFESGTVKAFHDIWYRHKAIFEMAMNLIFGKKVDTSAINVYVGKKEDHNSIAHGIHIRDNIIQMLLLNWDITLKPTFIRHASTLDLSNNLVRIDVELSPITMKADYLLFRNRTGYMNSPQLKFLSPLYFEELHGDIDLIAKKCRLVGIAITSLLGSSVHVGHTSFKVSDCKFKFMKMDIVIYDDMSTVFQIYGTLIENLLSRLVRDDVRSMVQGALISLVNNTDVFGPKLRYFRKAQFQIFEESKNFMRKLIEIINIITTAQNGGLFKLDDHLIIWNDIAYLWNVSNSHFEEKGTSTETAVLLTNLTMSGLDTAYSIHNGGPYNFADAKIVEDIRFHNLHVQGRIYCANASTKGFRKFFIEIKDLTISLKINLKLMKENKMKKYKQEHKIFKIDYLGWRDVDYNNLNKLVSKSFVSAYLLQEVPRRIIKYLYDVLPRATDLANSEINNDLSNFNNTTDSTNLLKHVVNDGSILKELEYVDY